MLGVIRAQRNILVLRPCYFVEATKGVDALLLLLSKAPYTEKNQPPMKVFQWQVNGTRKRHLRYTAAAETLEEARAKGVKCIEKMPYQNEVTRNLLRRVQEGQPEVWEAGEYDSLSLVESSS